MAAFGPQALLQALIFFGTSRYVKRFWSGDRAERSTSLVGGLHGDPGRGRRIRDPRRHF